MLLYSSVPSLEFFYDEVDGCGVFCFCGFDYGFFACARIAYPPSRGGIGSKCVVDFVG